MVNYTTVLKILPLCRLVIIKYLKILGEGQASWTPHWGKVNGPDLIQVYLR